MIPRTPRRPGTARVLLVAATIGACLSGAAVLGQATTRDAAAGLAVQARAGTAGLVEGPDTTFSVATFNILGSQHTRGDPTYLSGKKRARLTAGLVRDKGLDVIGLQEVQDDQLAVLRKRLPDYKIWPGKKLGRGAVRLQIAWRRDLFVPVSSGWLDTPFDRAVRPMPWVELRHRRTQRRIFVIDTHNSPRGLEAERDAATDQQLALINQLRASRRAVLFLGDMNERREIFCRVVSKTSLQAANGGSARSKRDCSMPQGFQVIDWIFGAGPLTFSGYQRFDGEDVARASDHQLIRAQVVLRPRAG